MVVDDQVAFRQAAIALVTATEGFEVVGEADSGEAAVHQAAGSGPLLVLMDITMPGIGGLRAARLIQEARPEAVLLLMSTYDRADLPAAVTSCGAAGVHKELLDTDTLRTVWREPGPGHQ